ncbi:MAG: GPW/gp25 family protein [Chloroflexi bacterium]|jgi:phage baseplate assembly protein W|nr:GPW/gp25 family protein [Chloroflexota bacterium]
MTNGSGTNAEKAFLGVGWAFPPAIEPDGTASLVAYEEDIRQSIRIILGTNPGERVMRPDFAAGLNDFLFEPLNATTLARIGQRVRDALIDWEPRIDVLDVRVTADRVQRSLVLIDVHYRVRATNNPFNLVYPFYLKEGAQP